MSCRNGKLLLVHVMYGTKLLPRHNFTPHNIQNCLKTYSGIFTTFLTLLLDSINYNDMQNRSKIAINYGPLFTYIIRTFLVGLSTRPNNTSLQ